MLSARHRLRHSTDFAAVMRQGARAGRSALVVHLLPASGAAGDPTSTSSAPVPASTPARVGFVVPKSVGNAVVRNLVVRRLRGLMSARIDQVPPGSRVVVRALPASATASSVALAEQLDSGLDRAVRRATPGRTSAGATA